MRLTRDQILNIGGYLHEIQFYDSRGHEANKSILSLIEECLTHCDLPPFEPSECIAKVQSDLFAVREELRDTLDDVTDARFIRLCAELGALAEEFLPEEPEAEDSPEHSSELFRGGDSGD